jgi:HK97 family phage major capsid protein
MARLDDGREVEFITDSILVSVDTSRGRRKLHLSIVNTLRQQETSNGALKFPALQDDPPMLLGRTMWENSNMDGTFDPAATANNYLLLYGSFAEEFIIADRIGSSLELVPHIFGANRRPTGQRGALLWFRTGSDVVNPNAFRLLNIATTA